MRNNLPLITIITPTYNRKELLEKAILSVINQNKDISFDWELLIVDDWSKDWTKEFIKNYLNNYWDNIKYFYQENAWMNNARNLAFDNMSNESDYITFLDADDEFKDDCFKTCLNKFNELRNQWFYDKTLWLFFFAEDEFKNLIWTKNILSWNHEIFIDYKKYLSWLFSFEPWFIFKSDFFKNKINRFNKDLPSWWTWILWADWWKKELWDNNNFLIFFDYIWRIYRQEVDNRLTFEFTKNKKRLLENARSQEKINEIIWSDLIKYWYKKKYAFYLFTIWINYILYWNRDNWIRSLKESLKYNFSIVVLIMLFLSWININLIYYIFLVYNKLQYKIYTILKVILNKKY